MVLASSRFGVRPTFSAEARVFAPSDWRAQAMRGCTPRDATFGPMNGPASREMPQMAPWNGPRSREMPQMAPWNGVKGPKVASRENQGAKDGISQPLAPECPRDAIFGPMNWLNAPEPLLAPWNGATGLKMAPRETQGAKGGTSRRLAPVLATFELAGRASVQLSQPGITSRIQAVR